MPSLLYCHRMMVFLISKLVATSESELPTTHYSIAEVEKLRLMYQLFRRTSDGKLFKCS